MTNDDNDFNTTLVQLKEGINNLPAGSHDVDVYAFLTKFFLTWNVETSHEMAHFMVYVAEHEPKLLQMIINLFRLIHEANGELVKGMMLAYVAGRL